MFYQKDNRLVREFDHEVVWIEPWGKDSFRVRATQNKDMSEENWALSVQVPDVSVDIHIDEANDTAVITNGRIKAEFSFRGHITFKNEHDEVILEEFLRQRAVLHDVGNEDVNVESVNAFSSTLKLKPREFKSILGSDDFSLIARFESDPDEKIFGMGQYQHPFLDLKNCTIELAHRNSQVTVPFYVSSKNYGFLWNNPGIGKVNFSKNVTEWNMYSTNTLDYWITVGSTIDEIEQNYANVTGKVPMMPEYGLGLWQSKMRYQTQEEVMEVARTYKEKGITPSIIVIDFFHWTEQGHYDFDERYWPDPEGMVKELEEMGIKTMISVWPTISTKAKNYQEYLEKGLLVRTDRGVRMTMEQLGNLVYMDPTNPKAREFVWNKLKKSYFDKGIELFWLDVAEPGYMVYDYDIYRYHKGTDVKVGNIFPSDFSKMVYDGLVQEGRENVLTLTRAAWAGSQKYGALVWSGDIDSSFKAFRNQINTGLNMSLAGIPWWTADIGGFHGGNPNDTEFRELMIRWFQYATFSPILRMHGDRQPHTDPIGVDGGGQAASGAPNEIWSYGEENERIFTNFIQIREALKPYLKQLMKEAHELGRPIMRPLFYDFPNDKTAWEIDNTFMFGPDVLVAPIIDYKDRSRNVYLPEGTEWVHAFTGKTYAGGENYHVEAPIDYIPIFYKADKVNQLPKLDGKKGIN
ncbi:TIM-barrel domain-containing protein [Neobacillus sp. 19]|uniref:glycoside hydrolase family 31 protein n=1 Tax=Neobacillus sp. 19 TaxID=3394458 RepID=UPI003BF7715F